MEWNSLTSENQLNQIIEKSAENPILIFKHSTRCSISSLAKNRLESAWEQNNGIEPYYLDLITYRAVSNQIESTLGIEHQSPQAILLQNGKVVYNDSHMGISYKELTASVLIE